MKSNHKKNLTKSSLDKKAEFYSAIDKIIHSNPKENKRKRKKEQLKIQKKKLNTKDISDFIYNISQEILDKNSKLPSLYSSLLVTQLEEENNMFQRVFQQSKDSFLLKNNSKIDHNSAKEQPNPKGITLNMNYVPPLIKSSSPPSIQLGEKAKKIIQVKGTKHNMVLLQTGPISIKNTKFKEAKTTEKSTKTIDLTDSNREEKGNLREAMQLTDENTSKFNDTKSLLDSILRKNTRYEDQSLEEYLISDISKFKKVYSNLDSLVSAKTINTSESKDTSSNNAKKKLKIFNRPQTPKNSKSFSSKKVINTSFRENKSSSRRLPKYIISSGDYLDNYSTNFETKNINLLNNKNLNKHLGKKLKINSFRNYPISNKNYESKSINFLSYNSHTSKNSNNKNNDNMRITQLKKTMFKNENSSKNNNNKNDCNMQKFVCSTTKSYNDYINQSSLLPTTKYPSSAKKQHSTISINNVKVVANKRSVFSRNDNECNIQKNKTSDYLRSNTPLRKKIDNGLVIKSTKNSAKKNIYEIDVNKNINKGNNKTTSNSKEKDFPLFNIKIDLKTLMDNKSYEINENFLNDNNSENPAVTFH